MLLGTSAWASTVCYLTWKGKVTPQGRLLFQLVPRTCRTAVTGAGLWPTATTSPGRPCEGNVRILRKKAFVGQISEAEAAQMLNGKSPMQAQGKIPALWPTPRTCSAMASNITESRAKDKFPNLEREVARTMWPTPSATMSKGSSPASLTRKDGRSRINDRLDHAVMAQDNGALNPQWVEWMMDFPPDWTSLETE